MMKLLLSVVGLCLFLSAGAAISRTDKISHELKKELSHKNTAEVMVYLGEEAALQDAAHIEERAERIRFVYESLKKNAQFTQANAIALLEKRKMEYRSYHIVSAIYLPHADLKLLRELSALPEVKRIELNGHYALKMPKTDLSQIDVKKELGDEIPENLKFIGADRVWNELGVRGEGIVIAGQDTGFAWQHPALKRQYRGNVGLKANHNYNWHDSIHTSSFTNNACGTNSLEPCDDSTHGTHTMGTMLGDDGDQNHIGVAPNAQWIGCRNMDQGVGTPASYLECFEYFLAPYPLNGNPRTDGRPDLAPHVINNSWGCPSNEGCRGEEFLQSVRALHAAGILVVVAAGNDGPRCNTVTAPPAIYSGEVVVVAALDHRNGNITSFSSRGPSSWNGGMGANVAAPGSTIRSSVPSGGLGDGLYDYMSGTSMASPHVAGAVALLWSARPDLKGKIAETFRAIEKSATPKTSSQSCGKFPGNQVPNAVFGYGQLNIYNAIKYKE